MISVLRPDFDLTDLAALCGFNHNSRDFEKKASQWFKKKYCLTYSSGSAGLYHILKANQIKNRKILISAYSCCVITEAIVKSGNQPVFIDVEKSSFNARLTEKEIRKYQPNLGAVVVTNLFGLTDFSNLKWIKKKTNCLLILDDALSPDDVRRKSKHIFDYFLVSCNVRKPFSSLGGGIILTNNKLKHDKLKQYTLKYRKNLRFCKRVKKILLANLIFFSFLPIVYPLVSLLRRKTKILEFLFDEKKRDIYKEKLEYFVDMMSFQKRVGINQLIKLDNSLIKRQQIGNLYYRLLKDSFPQIRKYWKLDTPYSHIPFLSKDRDKLREVLIKKRVDTEKYFDYAIPQIKQYGVAKRFPRSEKLAKTIVNLPVHTKLKDKDVIQIVDVIKNQV